MMTDAERELKLLQQKIKKYFEIKNNISKKNYLQYHQIPGESEIATYARLLGTMNHLETELGGEESKRCIKMRCIPSLKKKSTI